jgi:hypothetical protein
MRTWTLRIIGLLNILFAVFALSVEAVTLFIGDKFPTKVPPTPMDWVIFIFLLAVSNYLVVHPALYGIRLIKKDESALLPCALLFAAQTLLFILCVYILLFGRSIREIATGFWVLAVLPIQFSVTFGYSAMGLLVTITLLTLSRRAARNRAERDPATIQSTL